MHAISPPPTEAARNDAEDTRHLRNPSIEPEPATDLHPLVAVTVCPGTIDQPDADHVAFADRTELGPAAIDGAEHAAYTTLACDALRRGSDGRWRQLVAPSPLTGSLMGADCGPVLPHG